MHMTEGAAETLRDRVEEAVRAWFEERAEAGDMLTNIRYQIDVSYSAAGDFVEHSAGTASRGGQGAPGA